MSNLPSNARPLKRTDIVAQYLDLLTPQDYAEIEALSLAALRARTGDWGLSDAARSWTEGVVYRLLRKGVLRPLEALEAEFKKA